MARALSYQITRTPDGGYRVYLGGNQYVQRKTKLAIQHVISEHKMTYRNRGRDLAEVPSALVAELHALHCQCEEAGTTLRAAVDHWVPIHRARAKSVPLVDVIDDFVRDCRKAGLARSTVNERKHRLSIWLSSQEEVDITLVEAARPELIRGFLEEEAARTSHASARNVWAVISAFCTWSAKRDLLANNPCIKVEKPTPEDRPVKTLSPTEAEALLKLGVQHYDREVLSYLVLSLFSGLRPHEFVTEQRDGTWACLTWEAIGKKFIAKDRRLGKTRKARQIPINTTLRVWLEFITQREGKRPSGPAVSGYSFYQKFRRWKRVHYPDRLPPIENDILRHSYGTYRVIALQEVGKVALELGNSEATIRQHYLHGDRTENESEGFWALLPDSILESSN